MLLNSCKIKDIASLFWLVMFVSCSSVKKEATKGSGLLALKLSYKLEFVQDNGKLFKVADSLIMARIDDFTVYKVPTVRYLTMAQEDNEVLIDDNTPSKKEYYYVVSKPEGNIGYKVDSLNAGGFNQIKLDSFLQQNPY